MGRLFLSFWDLCLDNLPEGAFTHRRITPDEARTLLEQARQEKRLLVVTCHDLLAIKSTSARSTRNYAAPSASISG
jgi:hypothetical protein